MTSNMPATLISCVHYTPIHGACIISYQAPAVDKTEQLTCCYRCYLTHTNWHTVVPSSDRPAESAAHSCSN